MSAVLTASLAVAAAGLLSALSYFRKHDRDPQTPADTAYILENTVTHARLLPAPATHAFSYPTLALLLSLDALEAGALDLARGWLFGYGGTAWRLTGLRAGAYLLPDLPTDAPRPSVGLQAHGDGKDGKGRGRNEAGGGGAIKAKLAEVLVRQGRDAARVRAWAETGDAWMLTMPSYLGYEGINPLTVYFCYDGAGEDEGKGEGEGKDALAWVVLEIHNTFGEKHVHVLEPGSREEERSPPGYDHTWTFARDFHVSPFNDRLGFYTVSVAAPPPPRSLTLASAPPRPKIRIHLRTLTCSSPAEPDKLKLTATLFARRAVPLTSGSLLRALARYPFALLLSFARILYHAGILHYAKRLDVFPRPDPKPASPGWSSPSGVDGTAPAGVETAEGRVYGGIGWQPEGALEAYARRATERLLSRRADELDVCIRLVSGDPSVPRRLFAPITSCKPVPGLTIYYAAPRFFTTLLLAPSAEHMLLLGRAEDLFRVSSESLFLQVFAPTSPTSKASLTQRVRIWLLPARFVVSSPSGAPTQHPLDDRRPLLNALVICTLHIMDRIEKRVFTLLRARFVPGTEPWGRWDRAADLARSEQTASLH